MQTPTMQKKKETIVNVAYYSLITAVIALGFWLALRYLLPALYPFVIAYALSLVLNPIVNFLKRKLGLPRGLGAFLLVTAAVAIVFGIMYLLITRAVNEISRLTAYLDGISAASLEDIKGKALALLEKIPFVNGERLLQSLWQRAELLISNSLPGLNGAISIATGLFTGVLDFVLTFVITVVSCYYITVDREAVAGFFYKLCPDSLSIYLHTVRLQVFGTLWKYLKAYGLIGIITFAELFAAFTVLRLDYALLLSAAISLIDILPVLGTGTVLIPWGIACILITQNLKLGIGLIVTFAIITVIRQIIEPKIVGNYIGMHPLATMVAMFAGLKLFGVVGMLILPFAVLVSLNIMKQSQEQP